LEAELNRERQRRQELEWKLRQLLGKTFSKSSEKIDPAQLQLLLEGVAAVENEEAAQVDSPPDEPTGEKKRYRSKRTVLPEEMREEILEIDVPEEERVCPDTGRERKIIRWEETTKINFVPGQFVRVKIRRAVRAVPACDADDPLPEQPVVTAEMPAAYRVIPGCIAASGLLVYLMVAWARGAQIRATH
jgi:hypothetical protein